MRPRLRWLAIAGAALLLAGVGGCLWIGAELVAARPRHVGTVPPGFSTVQVPTNAGAVHGWWMVPANAHGNVLLLHGVRADRRAMLGRARLLANHGYAVLLIDLPGHGETAGGPITLGWREADAVSAAWAWLHAQRPGDRVGVIGASMGGAAVLLRRPTAGFDAVVLEAVYPDARSALDNRLRMRLGQPGTWLAPLLAVQFQPRTGVSLDTLRPVDHIADLHAPVMVVGGQADLHTTVGQTRQLYAHALPPKSLWLVPNAAHVDLYRHSPDDYAAKILPFLDGALRKDEDIRTPAAG